MPISSPGVGSGLDINSLVSQLVAAERAPADQRIAKVESEARADLSAFASIRSALDGAKRALTNLRSGDNGSPRSVTVADNASFTANAANGAPNGTYSIEVKSLASAQKLVSSAFAASTDVGTGTLTLEVGGKTHTLDFSAGATIGEIRDAINTAAAGKGISATVVRGDGGDALVLTALDAGTAGAIKITASGGDGGLNALVFDPTGAKNLTERTPAKNAEIVVDGITRSGSSNRFTDVIPNVTLDLTSAKPGENFDLNIETDKGKLRDGAQAFVNAYNAALTSLRNASRYDPATRRAAALNGDSAVRGIEQGLRNAFGESISELRALGFSSNKDGSLSFDGGKFDSALVADPEALKNIFGAEKSGFGYVLSERIERFTENDGLIDSRTDSLDSRLKRVGTDREALDFRIQKIESNYRRQFTALDTLVAQLQTTSSFLARQLAI